MMNNKKLPPFLAELGERLQKTGPLKLMDGSEISPVEIFQANLEFPMKGYTHIPDFPSDYTLANAFKHRYIQMGVVERARKMKEKGMPVVASFEVFPELIVGSGGTFISVMPCINEINLAGNFAVQQEGHRFASFESCPGEPLIALWIRDGKFPVDLTVFATSMGGDLPCILNLLRSSPQIPLVYIDIPYNGKGKSWALEYLIDQLRAFVQKLGQIRGAEVTDEEIRNGIRMMNRMRKSYREYVDIVTSAETPPIAGLENMIVTMCAWESGDPIAIKCANDQLNEELRERVRNGVVPPTMQERPLRIYMCEKMPAPPVYSFVESLGGILLGPEVADCFYLCNDVDEEGDPYEAVAKWYLEEWPWSPGINLEERTEWVIKTLNKYKPDGVIFTGVWGCQLDPPYGRYMADKIKERLDIPSLLTVLEDIPVEVGVDGKFKMKGDLRTRIEGFMEMLKTRKGL